MGDTKIITKTYANNLYNAVMTIAHKCIPNEHVNIKTIYPSWITSSLKYSVFENVNEHTKRSYLESDWRKFRKMRNNVVKITREAKRSFNRKLVDKLTSGTLSSEDWWSTLKSFILPKTVIYHPLEVNDIIHTDEYDKVNIVNNYT